MDEIQQKKDRFKELLSKGVSGPLDECLRKMMQENWHPLSEFPAEDAEFPKTIAVDGSMAERSLAGGGIFYVVRSFALCGKRKFRCLESDVICSRDDPKEITRYISHKSEWMEHKVAREAIEAEEGCKFLLIDGSLYGRLLAFPRDAPHEGQRGFMINYFQEYSQLLELCRQEDIIPIGVSKDSRITLLRDYYLSILLKEELTALGLSKEDSIEFHEAFNRIIRKQRGQRIGKLKLLESKYGIGRLEKLLQILAEAETLRSDHQMILNYTSSEGYSTPLELGAYGRGAELLNYYQRQPSEYAKRYFPEAKEEAEDPEKFLDEATEVISKIPSFSTIVSFHVRLDRRDTPIRVDVPSWIFGINRSLKDLQDFSPISDIEVDNVLSALKPLFGGLRHYNVLLTSVDAKVRLKRDTVDQIYLPLLERNLNLPLPLTYARGYRRGWYVH